MSQQSRVEAGPKLDTSIRISPRRRKVLASAVGKLIERLEIGSETSPTPYTPEEAEQAMLRGEPLGRRNIVGFGYGVAVKDGIPIAEEAISVYVVKKVDPDRVKPEYLASNLLRRFTRIKTRVDVSEVGNFQLHDKQS